MTNGIINLEDSAYGELSKYIIEVKKHRKTWVRDIDIYGILYKHISDYLSEHIKEQWKTSENLKEIIKDKGLEDLCGKIISYLESIPRNYLVFFELPSAKGLGIEEIKLTDDISPVERVNEEDFSEIRMPSGGLLGDYLGREDCALRKGKLYIHIRVSGYADSTLESSAIKKAYSKFKQIILLAKLSGMLRGRKESGLSVTLGDILGGRGIISALVIASGPEKPNNEKYCITLSKAVSDFISKLRIDENALKPDKLEILLDTFENKDALTPNDKAKILALRLQYPVKLLKTSDSDESTEPIKTAIEWAFDSLTNDNDTFAFIQSCIGLEAILGDREAQENLTNTLADRCAYLLGNTIPKRKVVRENFKKLYDIRSKLIHGRKANLDDEQRRFLSFAQDMLTRIIWKEIDYIQ